MGGGHEEILALDGRRSEQGNQLEKWPDPVLARIAVMFHVEHYAK
jgi:hypothetical protein